MNEDTFGSTDYGPREAPAPEPAANPLADLPDYALLSGLVYHPELFPSLRVRPEHMGTPATSRLLDFACKAHQAAGTLDEALLLAYAVEANPEGEWSPHVDRILSQIATPASFEAFQDKIIAAYDRRAVERIGRKLVEDGDASAAITAIANMRAGLANARGFDPGASLRAFVDDLENPPRATPSGIARIDAKLGGFHGGDLVIIGARPAMGKTALAVNMALRADRPFVFFSGEQGVVELTQRMVAIDGAVPLWAMRARKLEDHQWRKITDAVASLKQRNFYIVDTPAPTLADIVAEARRQKYHRGIELVLVDYLQRMRGGNSESYRLQVDDNVRGLKELARELDVPVICLAQVKREVDARPNKKPHMGDLKESGAIEAEADVVLMLYREVVYNSECDDKKSAELIVAKNRHGPTGKVNLEFHADVLRFDGVAQQSFEE